MRYHLLDAQMAFARTRPRESGSEPQTSYARFPALHLDSLSPRADGRIFDCEPSCERRSLSLAGIVWCHHNLNLSRSRFSSDNDLMTQVTTLMAGR